MSNSDLSNDARANVSSVVPITEESLPPAQFNGDHRHKSLRRFDSLLAQSTKVTGMEEHGIKVLATATILRLAFQSVGVVYGDVGTSPLYTFASTFLNGIDPAHKSTNILGALSLIIYTLTMSPFIKYMFLVLRANDHGEGGTFALYSIISRFADITLFPNQNPEDRTLSGYNLKVSNRRSKRSLWIKELLQKHKGLQVFVLFLALFATSMIIGESSLTPAISVLSAVQGIKIEATSLGQNVVVILSVIILLALFLIQRFGTDKVGFMFAPTVFIWFLFIGLIGVYNIFKYDPSVLKAFNPMYIYYYFKLNKRQGWISLGGTVLSITGTEAMFADVGHFSIASVRIAFSALVYPACMAAYIGQASYLMKHPEHVADTFYKSIPGPLYWPMFIVAVAAAIIASQAMISATFQIIKQAEAFGCFPRVTVIHTSRKFAGQVYIPELNYFIMCASIAITVAFRTTSNIGNAYGVCVITTMFITTNLLTLIMLMVWRTNLFLALAFWIIWGAFELIYISAVYYKFVQGGWLPVLFAALFLTIMWTWYFTSARKYEYEIKNKISVDWIVGLGSNLGVTRVPGIGLFYTELAQGIPSIFQHFITNFPAMHSVVVFVAVKHLPISNVLPEERFLLRRIGTRDFRLYRCVVRYGYRDSHRGEDMLAFEELLLETLARFIRSEGGGLPAIEEEMSDLNSQSLNVYPSNTTPMPQVLDAQILNDNDFEVEHELVFLEKAKEAGVTYLLGQPELTAKPSSGMFSRIIIDNLYSFLHKNCKDITTSLGIPKGRFLKVGAQYTI